MHRVRGRRPATHAPLFAVLVVAALAVAGCSTPPAGADPAAGQSTTPSATASPAPVSAVEIAKGAQPAPIDVAVSGTEGVTVTMREITIEPGAGTGVHCHDGQLIAVVKQGELTHYAPVYASGVHVYKAGDSLVEGAGYRHEGRNEGTDDVVLVVTYVIPAGDPLAETDLSKCDA